MKKDVLHLRAKNMQKKRKLKEWKEKPKAKDIEMKDMHEKRIYRKLYMEISNKRT